MTSDLLSCQNKDINTSLKCRFCRGSSQFGFIAFSQNAVTWCAHICGKRHDYVKKCRHRFKISKLESSGSVTYVTAKADMLILIVVVFSLYCVIFIIYYIDIKNVISMFPCMNQQLIAGWRGMHACVISGRVIPRQIGPGWGWQAKNDLKHPYEEEAIRPINSTERGVQGL